jgi:hypothetical protein
MQTLAFFSPVAKVWNTSTHSFPLFLIRVTEKLSSVVVADGSFSSFDSTSFSINHTFLFCCDSQISKNSQIDGDDGWICLALDSAL